MQLELPAWYGQRLVASPWFSPNPELIQRIAEEMARKYGILTPSAAEQRVITFDIDQMPDFTWPLTAMGLYNGAIKRWLTPGAVAMDGWHDPVSSAQWVINSPQPNVNELVSVSGGRLSVPNAWHAVQRSVEWDMRNAAHITRRAFAMDFHPFSARFDCHTYSMRTNNPYGFEVGSHPFHYMDGPGKAFPLVTAENFFHPVHNKAGWLEPVNATREDFDETWAILTKVGPIVLWFKHGHRFTTGAALDPVVMASAYHHTFLRGGHLTEPLWMMKGMSRRAEMYGAFHYEYKLVRDNESLPIPTMTDLLCGNEKTGHLPHDNAVVKGQAGTHCVPTFVEQAADNLEETGNSGRIKDIVVLMDCCANIPGFEEQATARWDKLAERGVQLRTSLDFNLYSHAA